VAGHRKYLHMSSDVDVFSTDVTPDPRLSRNLPDTISLSFSTPIMDDDMSNSFSTSSTLPRSLRIPFVMAGFV